jgi:putative membrane protein
MLLVRVVVNAAALLFTAVVMPGIYFVDPSLLNLLFLSVVLGLLNAFVKPVIQFATLRFIFATYGVVVALINGIILLVLSVLLPQRFAVDGLLIALIGGAVLGLVSAVLESLLGLTPPIVSEKYPDLRRRIASDSDRTIEAHVSQAALAAAGDAGPSALGGEPTSDDAAAPAVEVGDGAEEEN